jgi:hypothetical protein
MSFTPAKNDLSNVDPATAREALELGTTAAPPYLRVAGGYLYVQEAGVWKKTALSAL